MCGSYMSIVWRCVVLRHILCIHHRVSGVAMYDDDDDHAQECGRLV